MNMAENPSSPPTATMDMQTRASDSGKSVISSGQPRKTSAWGHLLVGGWALLAAIATATQAVPTRYLERSVQSLFFNLRGTVTPPADVVILAIDEYSMQPENAQAIAAQTKTSAAQLRWPFRRSVYATVIDRLMKAGTRAVALDILLLDPSSYGEADDLQLQRILQKYAGRVTLAAEYSTETIQQGGLTQFNAPSPLFRTQPDSIGFINFWSEPNNFLRDPQGKEGQIHRLGSAFPKLTLQADPLFIYTLENFTQPVPSFAEATLRAANIPFPAPQGDNIFFFGPAGTFVPAGRNAPIPFIDVLDEITWNDYLQQGAFFKDKIVVIGGTANSLQDFHTTPFGTIPGVEIQANAIATLLTNKAIAEWLPQHELQGLFVLTLVAAAAYGQTLLLTFITTTRVKKYLTPTLVRFVIATGMIRFVLAASIALAWGAIGYVAFVAGQVILPVAIPMIAILLSGSTYFIAASASDYQSKIKLLKILAQFPQSEVVRRIMDELDVEFQDLLQEPEQAFSGKKLKERYKITRVLGSGGFGRTYIAEDTDRPGNPVCVVKQLKPASDNPNLMQLARRLFTREAQTLEKLGNHDQIPQLLAYFEEQGEFYLVQEFISGHPLSQELGLGYQLPEIRVIAILEELLKILEFVHSQNVIHRDIKPSNIIRRESDGKLVLIDFGAVKVADQLEAEGQSALTVGIGTRGYMPSEQSDGKPRPNSDIYAIGMIGIQALTGLFPSKIREREDPRTGEIVWRNKARVSLVMADLLDRMVRYDYRTRYQSAAEVLQDLQELPVSHSFPPDVIAPPVPLTPPLNAAAKNPAGDLPDATCPWPETFDSDMLPQDNPESPST